MGRVLCQPAGLRCLSAVKGRADRVTCGFTIPAAAPLSSSSHVESIVTEQHPLSSSCTFLFLVSFSLINTDFVTCMCMAVRIKEKRKKEDVNQRYTSLAAEKFIDTLFHGVNFINIRACGKSVVGGNF